MKEETGVRLKGFIQKEQSRVRGATEETQRRKKRIKEDRNHSVYEGAGKWPEPNLLGMARKQIGSALW